QPSQGGRQRTIGTQSVWHLPSRGQNKISVAILVSENHSRWTHRETARAVGPRSRLRTAVVALGSTARIVAGGARTSVNGVEPIRSANSYSGNGGSRTSACWRCSATGLDATA